MHAQHPADTPTSVRLKPGTGLMPMFDKCFAAATRHNPATSIGAPTAADAPPIRLNQTAAQRVLCDATRWGRGQTWVISRATL
jgi:hypothetical protein